jgi:hypothetical protein
LPIFFIADSPISEFANCLISQSNFLMSSFSHLPIPQFHKSAICSWSNFRILQFHIFRICEFSISQFSQFHSFQFPKFPISQFPRLTISKFLDFRIAWFHNFRISQLNGELFYDRDPRVRLRDNDRNRSTQWSFVLQAPHPVPKITMSSLKILDRHEQIWDDDR